MTSSHQRRQSSAVGEIISSWREGYMTLAAQRILIFAAMRMEIRWRNAYYPTDFLLRLHHDSVPPGELERRLDDACTLGPRD